MTGIDRVARDNSPYHVDIRERLPVRNLIRDLRPDEIYYLAAFHHSSENLDLDSGDLIRSSFEINALALTNVLDAMTAEAPAAPYLFYASSSHVFGVPSTPVQNEQTPMIRLILMGSSKAAGMHCFADIIVSGRGFSALLAFFIITSRRDVPPPFYRGRS